MGFLGMFKSVLLTIKELFRFLWKKKMWWLIPFVAVLLFFGILFMLASTTGLGPFIYALF